MALPESGPSPFHEGEQAVQERMGVREALAPWARKVIRGYLPQQHREFYTQLPFIVAAARDARGRPWVTLLAGEAGFIASPDERTLVLAAEPLPGDALESDLGAGADLGLLGIELATRRRNRVNGTVVERGAGRIVLEVGQTFGNCPQYISPRDWHTIDTDPAHASSTRHGALSPSMQRQIARADTFFIGSGYDGDARGAQAGMDASHRGGTPGFVHVDSATRITFPDYAGNNHFNTIGNLVVDPRVALLFVDFESGGLLQITGRAEIDWDSAALAEHAGAQRLVHIDIDEIVALDATLPLRFSTPRDAVRELTVVRRRRESDDVVSFYLESPAGDVLPAFEAGQHLPLLIDADGHNKPVSRTYSLSGAPGAPHYRISVKREPRGLVSRLLHDRAGVGTVLRARPPAGNFTLGDGTRPVVLISAGIGVTPMVSMLHALTAEPSTRPITFLHGVRDGRHHPLAEEIEMIASRNSNVTLRTAYSRPGPEDRAGIDYDVAGRIDAALVRASVADLDADYFLCGPAPFLSAISDVLAGLGVDDAHVHVEQF